MVTETAPEAAVVEETTPEAAVTNEQVTQSDAANQNTDAAEQDVDAFLSRKEGTEGGTGADDELPELKAAREAAEVAAREKGEREGREKAQRETQAEEARKADAAARKTFEDGYKTRMEQAGPRLEARLIDLGIDSPTARLIANEQAQLLNSHHADGLKLHEPTARTEASRFYSVALNQAIKTTLGEREGKFFGDESDQKTYATIEDALTAYKEIVTDGLMTKAEAEADTRMKILAYRRDLEKKGLINGSKSGQTVNGSGASSGTWSTKTQARNLHANNQLSNAEMRRINADPTIPD